jgi:hypothetical protein
LIPETLNTSSLSLWADQRIIYAIAIAAVATLMATIWLFRRQQKAGRGAAFVCLVLAVGLHAALLFLVPMISTPGGGAAVADTKSETNAGQETISFSTFDPEMNFEQASAAGDQPTLSPLPINNISDLLTDDAEDKPASKKVQPNALADSEASPAEPDAEPIQETEIPDALATNVDPSIDRVGEDALLMSAAELDDALTDFFDDAVAAVSPERSSVPVTDRANKSINLARFCPSQIRSIRGRSGQEAE